MELRSPNKMTDNNLYKTDINISTTTDSCAVAKLEASSSVLSSVLWGANISLKISSPLKTNAGQKEVSVRITSKSRAMKLNDIITF